MKPLAIDLFAGSFGWSAGLVAAGFRCIGFDIAHEPYHGPVPEHCELVLQDIITIHGSQFRNAALIVASPPCQAYSYRAMPWKRAKALPPPSNELFDACFRIQREASEAAGRHIPMVVENVKGAQPWVGCAKWHYGSFYLWGDVPALMPPTLRHVKVDGFNFHQFEKTGKPGGSFQSAAVKNGGSSWFAIGSPGQKQTRNNPDGRKVDPCAFYGTDGGPLPDGGMDRVLGNLHDDRGAGKAVAIFRGVEDSPGIERVGGVKTTQDSLGGYGGGFGWDSTPMRRGNSKSSARKAASAAIAKIPFELAHHIGKVYLPSPTS